MRTERSCNFVRTGVYKDVRLRYGSSIEFATATGVTVIIALALIIAATLAAFVTYQIATPWLRVWVIRRSH